METKVREKMRRSAKILWQTLKLLHAGIPYMGACLVFLLFLVFPPTAHSERWKFPPLPEPYLYGNILINRTAEKNQMQPVFFSHWSHRLKYTCQVCHLDLGFEFKANFTNITEADNQEGRYCGACHNGKDAFGHTKQNCLKCHTGTIESGKEQFAKISRLLPRVPYGNEIDWTEALSFSKIKPRSTLDPQKSEQRPLNFKNRLNLGAGWNYVPPAFFPHDTHIQWLDCANCHPDIFNIKKKTTEHFSMKFILRNQFCGVCHLKVAFPLNDCARCHPGMEKFR